MKRGDIIHNIKKLQFSIQTYLIMTKGNDIMLIPGIIELGTGIFVFPEESSFQKGIRLTKGKMIIDFRK